VLGAVVEPTVPVAGVPAGGVPCWPLVWAAGGAVGDAVEFAD
jgi:hypothetical protein